MRERRRHNAFAVQPPGFFVVGISHPVRVELPPVRYGGYLCGVWRVPPVLHWGSPGQDGVPLTPTLQDGGTPLVGPRTELWAGPVTGLGYPPEMTWDQRLGRDLGLKTMGYPLKGPGNRDWEGTWDQRLWGTSLWTHL